MTYIPGATLKNLRQGQVRQPKQLAHIDGHTVQGCDRHGAPLNDHGVAGLERWHDFDRRLAGLEGIVLVVGQPAGIVALLQCHESNVDQQAA